MPYAIKPTPKGYGLWNKDKKIWKSYDIPIWKKILVKTDLEL